MLNRSSYLCFLGLEIRYSIRLDLFRESRVCLSVFVGLAKFLSEKFAASGEKPKVVVPTNINPKLVGGKHHRSLHISLQYIVSSKRSECFSHLPSACLL
ncbi:hypothetical protein Bca4012_064647 [Brassica carinata]